jgi:hypothetical protein
VDLPALFDDEDVDMLDREVNERAP